MPETAENETTVVIVEDDELVAQVNAAYLGARPGYRVVGVAQTVREAQTLLRTQRPDLALLDVYLPDGSGLELLALARREGWLQDAVMVTAARDAASVQQALSGGVADYLIKPFTQERLNTALDAIEARNRAMRGGGREFTQQALDRLLGHSSSQSLPRRVDAGTLDRVREVLKSSPEPLSAEEVGAELGINRATAWRYLEQLTSQGQAEQTVEYGAVGRPTKRYRLL